MSGQWLDISLDIGTVDTASDWVFLNFGVATNKANDLETYAVKPTLLHDDESLYFSLASGR